VKNILNIYIKYPLLWDIIIAVVICFLYNFLLSKIDLNIAINQDLITSIFSDLIGTSISLAGFVLASLTIIVTFKDNISQKNNANSSNSSEDIISKNQSGIALLFSSKHYSRIVGVFTWAVFIYLFLFLILSFLKLFIGKIDDKFYVYLCIVPIVLITLTIFRSVLVLYKIIKLQLAR
jgi:hypothetical protein